MNPEYSVLVEDKRVVVRLRDATVSVSLDPKSDLLVTLNRDAGGPTETIHRVQKH